MAVTIMDAWVGEHYGCSWDVCSVIDRGDYFDIYRVDLVTFHINTESFVKHEDFGFDEAVKRAEAHGYRKRVFHMNS